jgi:cytochrome bd ubiquinol oxidase subunit I
MFDTINPSFVDWSRMQFAMTAIYHWIFVPLTLGLTIILGIMETFYYRTNDESWLRTEKFWMKLFGINFCVGIATGLILEFEFGTNWSNYSWFVGDIFGAPLAIEGVLAFFMESTFIGVMFFGWKKVSRGFHLASTWLAALGATLSAWWILVANAWMQHPVGMQFNPDTMRNEMYDFAAVALSPTAVNKFCHTVLSGWLLGGAFVIGISCWFLLRKRERKLSIRSIRIAAIFGLVAALLSLYSGDTSAYEVGQTQPMKLAAFEGHYQGSKDAGFVVFGLINPNKKSYDDGVNPYIFKMEIPSLLSILSTHEKQGFVPGIKDLINGGYSINDSTKALSAKDKMAIGKTAISALDAYRAASKTGDRHGAALARGVLEKSVPYFGYGFIKNTADLIPNVPLNFYAFRVMVGLGFYFILFFAVVSFLVFWKDLSKIRWMQWVGLWSIVGAYIAGQAGWIVAECGRQPWSIEGMLPTSVSISKLDVGNVRLSFFIFLTIFTVLLIAGISIMIKAIKKGPENELLKK